tara:strand:- start:37 stop:456 length:420 start_codon:yes stop_codon:yes gene_type:complete
MRNILGSITQSMKEKWGEIVIGVTLLIILLLTFSLYNFSFDDIEKEEDKKEKESDTIEFIYEGMNNKFNLLCESDDLEKVCNKLNNSKTSCNLVNCCVWATNKNGGNCVEGNNLGPMIKEDKTHMKYDEYYYLNKKSKI